MTSYVHKVHGDGKHRYTRLASRVSRLTFNKLIEDPLAVCLRPNCKMIFAKFHSIQVDLSITNQNWRRLALNLNIVFSAFTSQRLLPSCFYRY